MSPAPGVRHQRASFRVHVILDTAARAAGAPVEVLEAINVVLQSGLVVPDLVVTDAGATAEDTVSVDADAVQLVVELVSPGNKTMDRKVKPLLYARSSDPALLAPGVRPRPAPDRQRTAGRPVHRNPHRPRRHHHPHPRPVPGRHRPGRPRPPVADGPADRARIGHGRLVRPQPAACRTRREPLGSPTPAVQPLSPVSPRSELRPPPGATQLVSHEGLAVADAEGDGGAVPMKPLSTTSSGGHQPAVEN
ncbi:Uma2 family endonuclease [Streptomyces avermitilis]|uniref:Uma2 family endonuclease n=1 Tax=Streptomyces avermitilis TaxID=33903 RepID=UPI0033BB4A48